MGTKYAALKVRQKLQEKVDSVEEAFANPVSAPRLRNNYKIKKELAQDKAQLAAWTPPDVTSDAERKALESRAALLESAMKSEMPTRREMQQTPAGSEGKEGWFQRYAKSNALSPNGQLVPADDKRQAMVFEWKDIQRRLYKEREEFDKDLCSIERFRPERDAQNSDGLSAYKSRSYGMPANYNEVIGTDRVSPIQQAIAQVEAEGTARAPRPEELIAQPTPKPVATCTYFAKSKGAICGAPALGGKPYCVGHSRQGRQDEELASAKAAALEQVQAENAKMAAAQSAA